MIENEGIRIRRATPDDVDFMLAVVTHEDVQPFLAARGAFDRERLSDELERQAREPEAFGRFVIEVLDKRESSSKPDRGVVSVETRAFNQRGERVCIFRRRVLVPKRSVGELQPADLAPDAEPEPAA